MFKLLFQLEIKRLFAQFRQGKKKAFGIFVYLLSLWAMLVIGGIFPLFTLAGISSAETEGANAESLESLIESGDLLATVDITVLLMFILLTIVSFAQMKDSFFHRHDQAILWPQPIDRKTLILSKFAGAWILTFPPFALTAFSAGSLVICYLSTHSILKSLFLLILFFAVALFSKSFGYFLRTLLTHTSRNFSVPKTAKSILGVIVFTALMVLYYYEIARQFQDLARLIRFYRSLPAPFHLMTYIMTEHLWVGFVVILVAALVFVAFLSYLSRHFFSIAERMGARSDAKNITDGDFKAHTPMKALVLKEIRLFWDNSTIATSSFFGVLFPVILTMLLFVPTIYDAFTGFLYEQNFIPAEAAIFLIFLTLAGLMNISSFLFSVEGRSAYVSYTLPLSGRTIFLGKLLSALAMIAPFFLISLLLAAIRLKLSPLYIPFYLIAPFAYLFFINGIALFFDLKFANYTWTSPREIVKNSKQAFFSSLGSIFLSLILIFIGVAIAQISPFLYVIILTLVLIVADAVLILLTKNLNLHHL